MSLLLLFRKIAAAVIPETPMAPEHYVVELSPQRTAAEPSSPTLSVALEPSDLSADLKAHTITADI